MTDDEIYNALQDGQSAKELAEQIKLPSVRVRFALDGLARAGRVRAQSRKTGKPGRPVVEYFKEMSND